MGGALSGVFKRSKTGDSQDESFPLPDEVLLLVFEYLSAEELLRVRGVSRRWQRLALSASPWRGQEVVLGMGRHFSPCCWRLVLARAPCVRKVWLSGRCAVHRVDADAVRCAFDKLSLQDVDELDPEEIGRLARLVAGQAELGGLRRLKIELDPRHSAADCTPLFEAIGNCAVERMTVRMWGDGLPRCSPEAWVPRRPNTLKKLNFIGAEMWPNPWLESLIRQHADSLERVWIFNPPPEFPCSLLAVCANLRLLLCPLLLDMPALRGCARLDELRLEVGRYTGPQLPALIASAVSFLSAATGLRKLCVDVHTKTDAGPDAATATAVQEVVAAVASTGRAALRSLTVSSSGEEDALAWLPPVLDRLQGLPHLEHLELYTSAVPPAGCLQSLASAPSLRSLRVSWCLQAEEHGEHLAQLRALLERLPDLHVLGLELADSGPAALTLGLPLDSSFNLYAHPEEHSCDLHTTNSTDPWCRL